MSRKRALSAWKNMHQRCGNPRNKNFKHYGGRDIKICKRWKCFECFYRDMGDPPPRFSLERIHNGLGYNPKNCKWADAKEQSRNRRSNVIFKIGGKEITMVEAAELVGISYFVLRSRINRGWPMKDALNFPVGKPGQNYLRKVRKVRK